MNYKRSVFSYVKVIQYICFKCQILAGIYLFESMDSVERASGPI